MDKDYVRYSRKEFRSILTPRAGCILYALSYTYSYLYSGALTVPGEIRRIHGHRNRYLLGYYWVVGKLRRPHMLSLSLFSEG